MLPDSKTGPQAVQLPPPARAVLNTLPRTGPFVFPNRTGDAPMTDLGRRWHTLRAPAGLDDVRIHDCRHTLASHAVMSGLDLYTVGRLLGHADTASTERYAHLADEHMRAAAPYTLIVTAKLNDVDPQAWLADVLARIAELPHTRVHELLPWDWKAVRHQALAA